MLDGGGASICATVLAALAIWAAMATKHQPVRHPGGLGAAPRPITLKRRLLVTVMAYWLVSWIAGSWRVQLAASKPP